MSKEIWKEVVGYESYYQVSDYGNVRSVNRVVPNGFGGEMRVKGMSINSRMGANYINITLTKNGKKNTFNVHRLVAIAFLPNPNNLPYVNHIDGNKLNNCDDNLEWSTEVHNSNHSYNMGLSASGSSSHYAKVSERTVAEIIHINNTTNLTYAIIGQVFGVCAESVSNMCRGKSWNRPLVRKEINEHLQKLQSGEVTLSVDVKEIKTTPRNWRRR